MNNWPTISSPPTSSNQPPGAGRRRHHPHGGAMTMVVGTLAVIGVVFIAAYFFLKSEVDSGPGPLVADVTQGSFDHIILEQGEVESSANVEIRSEVKSRNTTGTQILWVIAEGSHMKKGEPLVKLDSSALERERDQQSIVCNTSRAVMVQAENTYEAAKISLKEYLEGTYKQAEQQALSEVFLAEQNLRTSQLSFKSGERLAAKGIVTSLQLEGDQFAVDKARNELEAAQTRLRVLQNYTKPKMLKQFESDIVTADTKWDSEKKSYALEEKKLKDINDQIAKCEIDAPQDGQVVYANIVNNRGGGSEFVVEAGANVREGQVILRLPDPTLMQVKAKINESRVTMIRTGLSVAVKLDAVPDRALQGVVTRVNQYAEPSSFMSSQVKEYATFIRILDPPPQIRTGLTAEVQILVQHRDDAIQVPVQGTFEHGRDFYCLVKNGEKAVPELRKIKIGSSNDKFVTVESGLSVNEKVILDPRSHLEHITLPKIVETRQVATVDPALAKMAANPQKGSGGAEASRAGGEGGAAPRKTPAQRFAELDKDGDQKISAEEMQAANERFRPRLQQADTNGDGSVDRSEFFAMPTPPQRGAGGRAPNAGGGGP